MRGGEKLRYFEDFENFVIFHMYKIRKVLSEFYKWYNEVCAM